MLVVAESLMYLPVHECCLDIMPAAFPFLLVDLDYIYRVRNRHSFIESLVLSVIHSIAGYIALDLSFQYTPIDLTISLHTAYL